MMGHEVTSFSVNRLLALIIAEATEYLRPTLLASIVVAAVIVLFHLTRESMNPAATSSVLAAWMGWVVFFWGLIVASKAFEDMHSRRTMPSFLLLPASALEKTTARYLLVTPIFGLYLCLFGAVVSLLCALMSFVLLGEAISLPAIFEKDFGSVVRSFILTQSVFFLGGAWFRKSHAVKTGLAMLVVFIALLAFTFALLSVLTPDAVFSDLDHHIDFDSFLADYDDAYLLLARTTMIGLMITIPVLCFFLAWQRVREVQLSDGI